MLFYLRSFSFYVVVLLLFSALIFVQTSDQFSGLNNIKISTENNIIYDKSEIETYFDYNSQLKYSCIVPQVLEDDINVNSRIIKIENQKNCEDCIGSFVLQNVAISSDRVVLITNHNFTKQTTLQNSESLNIKVDYNCYENDWDSWSLLTFTLMFQENSKNITFSYIKVCNMHNNEARFDFSYLILAIFTVVILGFASRFSSLVFFKNDWEKYEISLFFVVLYLLGCAISILLVYYFCRVSIIIFIVIIAVLSSISIFVILLEMVEFLPKFLQCKFRLPCKYLKKITIGSIIISFISFAIVVSWAIFKHYILNDICAFSIVIFSLKIIRVSSIKMSIVWVSLVMIFELMWGLLLNYALGNSYDTFFSSEYCLPTRIIIPSFKEFLHEKCSWLPISSLIFPGFTLEFLHKFDKSKNIHIYFRTGIFSYAIGAMIWIIVDAYSGQTIPMSFFSYPLIIIFIMILSYLRNEHTELWKGSFFDGSSFEQSQQSGGSQKSLKSLSSNYNKEEVFEGLLSKKDLDESQKRKTIDANKINSHNDDSSKLQE